MAIIQISPFTEKVLKQIASIPAGKVATYKQIAELAGNPLASRGVAWILHSCSTKYKLPWHRVLSSQGRVSFPILATHFKSQIKKLRAEGVEVSSEGRLDLQKYQWKKRKLAAKVNATAPKMFSK